MLRGLQQDISRIASEMGMRGMKVRIATPVPPPKSQILPGRIKHAIVQVCRELNSTGTIVGKYADKIVSAGPSTLSVDSVKPCADELLAILKEASEAVQENRSAASELQQKLWDPVVEALQAAIDVIEAVKLSDSEPETATRELVEIFFGYGEDPAVVRDAYRKGGVPAAFEAILELGEARGYKLAVIDGELVLDGGDAGVYPIQFADDDLLAERVQGLIEELSEEPVPA